VVRELGLERRETVRSLSALENRATTATNNEFWTGATTKRENVEDGEKKYNIMFHTHVGKEESSPGKGTLERTSVYPFENASKTNGLYVDLTQAASGYNTKLLTQEETREGLWWIDYRFCKAFEMNKKPNCASEHIEGMQILTKCRKPSQEYQVIMTFTKTKCYENDNISEADLRKMTESINKLRDQRLKVLRPLKEKLKQIIKEVKKQFDNIEISKKKPSRAKIIKVEKTIKRLKKENGDYDSETAKFKVKEKKLAGQLSKLQTKIKNRDSDSEKQVTKIKNKISYDKSAHKAFKATTVKLKNDLDRAVKQRKNQVSLWNPIIVKFKKACPDCSSMLNGTDNKFVKYTKENSTFFRDSTLYNMLSRVYIAEN
jgi:hypothetical protein